METNGDYRAICIFAQAAHNHLKAGDGVYACESSVDHCLIVGVENQSFDHHIHITIQAEFSFAELNDLGHSAARNAADRICNTGKRSGDTDYRVEFKRL